MIKVGNALFRHDWAIVFAQETTLGGRSMNECQTSRVRAETSEQTQIQVKFDLLNASL